MSPPLDPTTTPVARSPRGDAAPAVANGSWVSTVLATLLIGFGVVLAYANSFPGAFFFDDDDAIVLNTSIRDLHNWKAVLWPPLHAGIGGRPFANLTFALNYATSGYHPTPYHATNLVIHLLGALLLFGLVRRTLQRPLLAARFGLDATWIACLAALLWALHPVQTNIVDYMSQRTEGLMAALYLLTLYAFLRASESGGRGWSIVAFTACLLGMATKEGMVTAPFVVLLFDRTFITGSFVEALRRHWPRHLALAATWLLLAGLMNASNLNERGIGFGLGQSGYTYALTECRTVVRYLQLSFWPAPLLFDYGPKYYQGLLDPGVLPSAVLLVLVLAGTAIAFWRAPALGFAAAWFFILLSPSSSVVPVVQQPCAENRMYLPLAGVMVLLAAVSYRIVARAALAGLLLVCVAFGVGTFQRNPVFASELNVWWDTVAKRPGNARAQNNLGNVLLKVGRTDEAVPHFERAIALSPKYADAHNNRGVTLLRAGKLQEALAEFKTASSCKENYADAHYNMGEAYLQLGHPQEAITELEFTLRLQPSNAKALNNIGIAYLDTGRVKESIAAEKQALAIDPQMPEAHYNLGNSYSRNQQLDEALAEYAETLRISPTFAKAHNNAGVILLGRGQVEEAGREFEAAVRINPNYPEARRNLELVRSRRGAP